MKKVLKWIGILLGALVVLLVAAALVLSFAGASRLNKTRDVTAERITVAADDAALARGEHLVDVACRDCHGADLSGQPIIDEGPIGTIYAANISGVAETHSDADLVRAIRHGVDTDGRQLIIMPSTSFVHFSEEDLGAIIAYLKTVPRAGEDRPAPRLGPLGRILMGSGMFGDVFSAEQIEHDAPFHEMPEVGANAAYGEYVSRFCSECHGEDLSGGQPPEPDAPPAPDLSVVAGWSEEDFLKTMHSGLTPSGKQLDPAYMPWPSFGQFSDDELRGLWMYLQSRPVAGTATD